MYARLVPTSFTRVRTLFTVEVLDQFRYANLEMKASAWQFFQMLRRNTMPLAPATVINFYHELRRMSRLWRWMKRLKWAGYRHKVADPMKPDLGELVPFCPACPQEGINIPADWRNDPQPYVLPLNCSDRPKYFTGGYMVASLRWMAASNLTTSDNLELLKICGSLKAEG
jgi:hypothetical protein